MSGDDIVERLRRWDDGRISTHYEGCWDSHPVCAIVLAADAIDDLTVERDATRLIISDLTAEVDRLRAAGDALAEALDDLCYSYCGNEADADLVDAWQEARRG